MPLQDTMTDSKNPIIFIPIGNKNKMIDKSNDEGIDKSGDNRFIKLNRNKYVQDIELNEALYCTLPDGSAYHG